MREREGGKVRNQLNVEQMLRKTLKRKRRSAAAERRRETCLWGGIMQNDHENKLEEIGVTACDQGRYAGMISPSITRKLRVSSSVADSRSCCHPLLVENS